jgi:hypothetical protein
MSETKIRGEWNCLIRSSVEFFKNDRIGRGKKF